MRATLAQGVRRSTVPEGCRLTPVSTRFKPNAHVPWRGGPSGASQAERSIRSTHSAEEPKSRLQAGRRLGVTYSTGVALSVRTRLLFRSDLLAHLGDLLGGSPPGLRQKVVYAGRELIHLPTQLGSGLFHAVLEI